MRELVSLVAVQLRPATPLAAKNVSHISHWRTLVGLSCTFRFGFQPDSSKDTILVPVRRSSDHPETRFSV